MQASAHRANTITIAIADCEGLGRIAIMEGNTVVMLGKIISIERAQVR